MSTFENRGYRWRETYFVLFSTKLRPTVSQLEHAIVELNDRFELQVLQADDEGRFEAVTLVSPEDFAALDICYVEGDEVVEQSMKLAEEMRASVAPGDMGRLKRLSSANARIDVLHFRDVAGAAAGDDDDELDEMFDPSALLIVLDALVDLTKGIAVDPQSGTMV